MRVVLIGQNQNLTEYNYLLSSSPIKYTFKILGKKKRVLEKRK
jgi:hypothetical protein